jgi:hypothetical protein
MKYAINTLNKIIIPPEINLKFNLFILVTIKYNSLNNKIIMLIKKIIDTIKK